MFLLPAILYILERRLRIWHETFSVILSKSNQSTRFASDINKFLRSFNYIRLGVSVLHFAVVIVSFTIETNAVNIASVALDLVMWFYVLVVAAVILRLRKSANGDIKLSVVRIAYWLCLAATVP